ncbi:bifunctional protein-serine/threonine kinase/phosphatase [soil metagenome]
MSGSLRIGLGQHSEAGRKSVNQDFHGATLPTGSLLRTKGIAVALADGIGSSAVSQLASAAAVRGFLDDYYCSAESWSVRRAAQCVLAATNSWLHAQTQRGDGRFDKDRGHVCTFSALVFKGREVHLLHVGDTRVYRLHPAALEQLSDDHRVHVSSVETYLGRALGVGPRVEVDYARWNAEPGEIYLLATDGAYDYLDASAVHAALAAQAGDLQAAAEALVAEALARGSQDNVTLQLVRVEALPAALPHQLPGQREGLALPPPLRPRMSFEGYTIVRELHVSPRSHVFLALDEASGRQVVLKTPSVDLRENLAYLDRFVLEEWVARRIDSPHVLKAVVTERPRRHLFVALEYIEGQTLSQWMTDHPKPTLDSVRRIVSQIAKGLQALHRKEMLHQDLRPANVMIDRQGTVTLIDLGATHVAGLSEGTGEAGALALVGELQYAAPEYFTGDGGSVASDLFSLAVLSYQMLTGRLPYGLQVTQVRGPRDLHRLQYEPVRTRRPELPAWLDAVLRKALHPQAARRQGALSEFMHDLSAPGPQFMGRQNAPLLERNPLAFWRTLALLASLATLLLLALRAGGH